MSVVADLLAASQAAHQTALLLRQRRDTAHRDHLIRARDLRLEAHAADPAHADPAWALERADHDALLVFYARMLERPPRPPHPKGPPAGVPRGAAGG